MCEKCDSILREISSILFMHTTNYTWLDTKSHWIDDIAIRQSITIGKNSELSAKFLFNKFSQNNMNLYQKLAYRWAIK